ncbi:EAL domain-containing protein [Ferrimonas lipolytica]|uniref:EAL domain-containing protein n=1 Tax=Ferrimonas lipolytica TaxID=2724191 RepID=A0A6H1UFU3_9GAMM|nr:EAL domain-containing protein [Ferrimonas lipolytica]QIZ77975.1 EAL domain-containing protein [Ferrimonas lipolytica]
MSLFRVLLLGLLLLVGAISVTSASLYLRGSQQFLSQQLAVYSQDTATSLGLSLAPVLRQHDWVLAESMLDSIFDQGDYALIRLTSLDGAQELLRQRTTGAVAADGWFERLLPLRAPVVSSQINSQWQLVATVEVQASAASSQQLLWQTGRQALLVTLFIAIIAIVVASWLLTRVLKPLALAEQQANGLRRHHYIRQEQIPSIREMASLVRTMNLMVDNSEAMVKQQVVRMERLRRQTLVDDDTGLGNLSRYQQRVGQALKDREHQGGTLLKLHLTGIDRIELQHGSGSSKTLLQQVAATLTKFALQLPLGRLYRTGFAEFTLLFPGLQLSQLSAEEMALRGELSSLVHQAGADRVLLAACEYHLNDQPNEVEQQLELLLSEAIALPDSSVFKGSASATEEVPLAQQQQLLQRLLNTAPSLLVQSVENANNHVLHREILTRFNDGEQHYNPGPVMAMAARQQSYRQLDLLVLNTLKSELGNGVEGSLSCNLTAESVLDPQLPAMLQRILDGYWQQLLLEIPERALLLDADATVRFIERMALLGARIWLDHTTPAGMVLMSQHGLEGIKLDPGYTRALLTDGSHSDLIEMMIAAAHSRGISVVAQQVEEPELANALWQLGIDGVQGFAVAKPVPLNE